MESARYRDGVSLQTLDRGQHMPTMKNIGMTHPSPVGQDTGASEKNGNPILLVDKRQVGWQEAHLRGSGFNVKMCMLPSGDFAWSTPWGRVGVEDKPLTALVTDRRTGQLDDELYRLVDQYQIPILMIRGFPDVSIDGSIRWLPQEREYREGWTIDSLDNLLLGRQFKGVYVVWCPTDGYLGERLKSLYSYTQRRPQDEHLKPQRGIIMPWLGPLSGRAELIYTLLGQVKGIRNRRELSEALANKYSLEQVYQMGVEGWMEAGLTKLMANKVVQHVVEVVFDEA